MHITNVAVHTAYQGLGLGRSLIEETRILPRKIGVKPYR